MIGWDGQKVRVEYVSDGLATCKRIGGEWDGMIAVCEVSKLKAVPRAGEKIDSRR